MFYILLRRPSDSVSLSPFDWSVAIAGSLLPMLSRPGGHPLVPVSGLAALWLAGLWISVAAKLSLNRRFGVAPANRGVQVRGAYAYIRHPMYAGYLLMDTAYLILNPTPRNFAVYAVAWTCQFVRIGCEENWLRKDPAYVRYLKAVPYRLVPLLF